MLSIETFRPSLTIFCADVTLSRLFEGADPPVESAPGLAADQVAGAGSNVGLIAGASVGAIAAVAIICVVLALAISPKFRRAVLPYESARIARRTAPLEEIAEDPTPKQSRGWIKSTKMEPIVINEKDEIGEK
jgi:hypothetical protein